MPFACNIKTFQHKTSHYLQNFYVQDLSDFSNKKIQNEIKMKHIIKNSLNFKSSL